MEMVQWESKILAILGKGNSSMRYQSNVSHISQFNGVPQIYSYSESSVQLNLIITAGKIIFLGAQVGGMTPCIFNAHSLTVVLCLTITGSIIH